MFSPLLTFTTPSHTDTLSLHDALPISDGQPEPLPRRPAQRVPFRVCLLGDVPQPAGAALGHAVPRVRSEEHTSELQSLRHLVCRLLLEKKKEREISYTVLPQAGCPTTC